MTMTSHATLVALLTLAGAASASAATPAVLGNLGSEPACPADTFFALRYERQGNNEDRPAKNVVDKTLHPFEVELVYGARLDALDAPLARDVANVRSELSRKAAAAVAEARKAESRRNAAIVNGFAAALRPRIQAAVRAQQARTAAAPGQTLHMAAARQVVCRAGYAGKRSQLDQSLLAAQPDAAKKTTSVAYWTAFHRGELARYLADTANTAAPLDYRALWTGMKSRFEDALAKAADPAAQNALISANGVPHAVAVPTSPSSVVATSTGTPSTTTVAGTQPAADPFNLTNAELLALPDKLQLDYRNERRRLQEANPGKRPEEVPELRALVERNRDIVATRRAMPADHRRQFDARIAAAATPQARDAIVREYRRSYSPQRQLLDSDRTSLGAVADGTRRRSEGDPVVAGPPSTSTVSGLTPAEIAEQEEAARRERERSTPTRIDGNVPNLTGGGQVHDGKADPEPEKKDKNKIHVLNGAKLGVWGALVGALFMGPLGALFLGGLCLGLGTLISKEIN